MPEQPDPTGEFSERHPPNDLLARAYEEREIRRQSRSEAGRSVRSGSAPDGRIIYTTGAGQPARDPQFDITDEALAIYFSKNEKRSDSWRGAGWKGNLVEMRKKLDRLWAVWDGPVDKKDIDEALDLINATVFYIRCVREQNPNGNWPWPN